MSHFENFSTDSFHQAPYFYPSVVGDQDYLAAASPNSSIDSGYMEGNDDFMILNHQASTDQTLNIYNNVSPQPIKTADEARREKNRAAAQKSRQKINEQLIRLKYADQQTKEEIGELEREIKYTDGQIAQAEMIIQNYQRDNFPNGL